MPKEILLTDLIDQIIESNCTSTNDLTELHTDVCKAYLQLDKNKMLSSLVTQEQYVDLQRLFMSFHKKTPTLHYEFATDLKIQILEFVVLLIKNNPEEFSEKSFYVPNSIYQYLRPDIKKYFLSGPAKKGITTFLRTPKPR